MSATLCDSSRGVLPPIPALIPIHDLNDQHDLNVVSGRLQRHKRTQLTTTTLGIDPDTEQAPTSRRRHRKSERHNRRKIEQNNNNQVPRVNPIFLWVKQEDTRIVEVRCEDYDKRNRIRLTKTAHGWRAIPRTETLGPPTAVTHDKKKHKKRSKKNRSKVRSTVETCSSPSWNAPVNIESHLPSHQIPRKKVSDSVSDTTPLDNLLAVAEFEFNHQDLGNSSHNDDQSIDLTEQHKEFFENIVQLNKLLESRTATTVEEVVTKVEPVTDYNEDDDNHHLAMDDIITRLEQSLQSPEQKDVTEEDVVECIDDVEKLCAEATTNIISTINKESKEDETPIKIEEDKNISEDISEPDITTEELSLEDNTSKEIVEEEEQIPTVENDIKEETPVMEEEEELKQVSPEPEDEPEIPPIEEPQISTTTESIEDLPTDLSVTAPRYEVPEELDELIEEDEEIDELIDEEEDDLPTDLSIPKPQPLRIETPRPQSHSSETIQSPQPSGIPAVPPSPDIFFNNQKPTNKFLESLLSSTSPKLCLTPEVTITRHQQQPLDLGKSRKSASPTVTCSSEEIKFNNNEGEPNAKRLKLEDITLKNLLHKSKELKKPEKDSRLLQLLTNETDPLQQFKTLLNDPDLNIPDPLLVPKDRLNQILLSPSTEIPRLLTERPELRLPDALAYPQLLQNPDILVISAAQLQIILQKQTEPKVKPKPTSELLEKPIEQPKKRLGLAGDIDAATTAAFNQMLWLPYLNQLEAMGNNNEFLKALNNVLPGGVANPPLFNEFNYNFPHMAPPIPHMDYNNLEMALWQESLLKNQPKPFYPRNELFVDTRTKKSSKHSAARTSPITPNFRLNEPYLNPYQQWNPPKTSPRITSSDTRVPNVPNKYRTKEKPPPPPRTPPQKPRLQCKSLQNLLSPSRLSAETKKFESQLKSNLPSSTSVIPLTTQPMDLSPPFNLHHLYQQYHPAAMQQQQGKIKVKSNLMEPRHLGKVQNRVDEVPEVGSTTSSLDDISHHNHHGAAQQVLQDAQNHLWHPLFGNQKSYTSPWRWTTVTVNGE